MNRLLIALLSVLWISVAAQPKVSPLRILYTYHNAGSGKVAPVELLVQGAESLTIFHPEEESPATQSPDKEFAVEGADEIGRRVYKNLSTGETFFRDYYPQGMEFHPCLVSDPLKPLPWTFGKGEKTIGNYRCRQAFVTFRGRSYEVWYATDLPIAHGPWKFSRLPGAMVEIRSSDGMIRFDLVKVETITKAGIERPNQGKPMTMEEFVGVKEKSLDEFISALRSKLPRGAEITYSTRGDYNLETDFSDIKR